MFNRFTDKSRRCVEAAFEEARMLGHDSLGDEDPLLGVLRADEGIATEVLSSLVVTLEDAREESEQMLSAALSLQSGSPSKRCVGRRATPLTCACLTTERSRSHPGPRPGQKCAGAGA